MIKAKIYISDEGYGHIVRQYAIYQQLKQIVPDIEYEVQTHRHISFAKQQFKNEILIDKFNNIQWFKKNDGTPDLTKINSYFSNYQEKSEKFISTDHPSNGTNLIISDFVYEAFGTARKYNLPSFGVCHFPWDWFLSKLYPSRIPRNVFKTMENLARSAERIYFPLFTPPEVLRCYNKNCISVPLIVRNEILEQEKLIPNHNKFVILMMDSGENIFSRDIYRYITSMKDESDVLLVGSNKFPIEQENFYSVPDAISLSNYISSADLVVTRGGFNTISECICHRTPMLLVGESFNPEMDFNLLEIKKQNFGTIVSREILFDNFRSYILEFINSEYGIIKRTLRDHQIKLDGARVIAVDIANRLKLI
jgi:uncharacterized protein (TIGR00661 family)